MAKGDPRVPIRRGLISPPSSSAKRALQTKKLQQKSEQMKQEDNRLHSAVPTKPSFTYGRTNPLGVRGDREGRRRCEEACSNKEFHRDIFVVSEDNVRTEKLLSNRLRMQ